MPNTTASLSAQEIAGCTINNYTTDNKIYIHPLDAEISVFKNAFDKTGGATTLRKEIDKIQRGDNQAEVEKLRELYDSDKGSYDKRKPSLPAFIPAGLFNGRTGDPSRRSRIVVIDIDGKKDGKNKEVYEHADYMADMFKYDEYCMAGFVSPSGRGIKLFYFADDPGFDHKALFKAAKRHAEMDGRFTADEAPDINRLCFTSYDAKAFIKEDALPLPIPDDMRAKHEAPIAPLVGDRGNAKIETMLATLAKTPAGVGHNHNDLLNKTAFFLGQEVAAGRLTEAQAHDLASAAGAKGATPGSERKVINTIARGVTAGINNPMVGPLSDSTNAELFIKMYSDLAYNTNRETWMLYSGGAWRDDEKRTAVIRAKDAARAFDAYGNSIQDDSVRAAVKKFALKSESAKSIDATLKLATAHKPIIEAELDANPLYFNCKNGTLSVEDFSFRPHQADDFLSKQSNFIYDPAKECSEWEKFMADVFEDADLRLYVQKAVSLALIGRPSVQSLFFALGEGANGKTTLIETLLKLFGDYGQHMPAGALLAKKQGGGASPEMARLKGARLVVAHELPSGAKWDDQTIKTLTGGDTLTARFLYGGFFEWAPTHTLFVIGNFAPQFSGEDPAMERRLNVIPFTKRFTPDMARPQHELFAAFEIENSGILNWLIEGLKSFHADGLTPPEAVIEASKSYADDNNSTLTFLRENVIKSANVIHGPELYARYDAWCKATGGHAMGRKRFYISAEREAVKLFGARKKVDHRQSVSFEGLELLPTETGSGDCPF